MNRHLFKSVVNIYLKRSFSRVSEWSELGTAFNTRPNRRNNIEVTKTKGLFEVPELKTPEGFHILKARCKAITDDLIGEAISDGRSRKMVEIFDELSDNLCRVADLAEFIRLAHPSTNYNKAAEEACNTVSEIVEKLNTHKKLYDALVQVVVKGDYIGMSDVDLHVAKLFQFDFEQSGIHLPEAERNKVVQLNDKILHLGQQFSASASIPRTITKDTIPANMHKIFKWQSDKILINGINPDSENPTARELAYRVYLYPDPKQDQILMDLLNSRHELAVTCDFKTYSHRAINSSLLINPEITMKFLNQFSHFLKPRAKNDFDIMASMKAKDTKDDNNTFAAWDVPYYTQRYKKDILNVSAIDYSPYFSLGACMEGINSLCRHLYGISLVNEDVSEGECWIGDIYKLAVMHETEGLLGHIYCDFYERSNKANQDSHFTIKGGKELPDGSYQMPVVVLLLNFSHPQYSSPTLLNPNMLDNLFHEMGHALHSMLARTKYQHVTGTRCSTDFAEVPSILMEYFARDPRVLRMFAKHFQTKEALPEDMLKRLCASKLIFKASKMQMQLFYSALDQYLHIDYPLSKTSTSEILEFVHNEYFGLPHVKNTAWQLRFSHLVGYGAKYYSYLVSNAVAYLIWQTYFAADPLSRAQGEWYRHECLAHGGCKSPYNLIADFLQMEPSPSLLSDALIQEIDSCRDQLDEFAKVNRLAI